MIKKYVDQEIIEAFRLGGQARERVWYFINKEWRDQVISTIVSKGGTSSEALEAQQEIAVPFEWRVRRSDFILRNKLSTYFIKCVYYRWLGIKKMERDSKTEEFEDIHIAEFVESVEQEIVKKEKDNMLDDILSLLGDRCKKILLYYINRYTMVEVAENMGFASEHVAKNEKKKCKDKLSLLLRENPLYKNL